MKRASSKMSLQELELLAKIQDLQLQLNEVRKEEKGARSGAIPEGAPARRQRLVVVANRLPLSMTKDAKTGDWEFSMSGGGLVTALEGVKSNTDFLWVGWPGAVVDWREEGIIRERLLKEHCCAPVFLPRNVYEPFYNGYCNEVLWPLFHYMPMSARTENSTEYFQSYKKANEMFADALMGVVEEGDIIWVHDYQLMLLPRYLKKRMETANKRNKIGFFLHIPFPSSEIFRILPERRELLRGVLNADVVGFHTYDYARHFLSTCTRVMGLESTPRGVDVEGRVTQVLVFPIGIDPGKWARGLQTEAVRNRIAALERKFAGKKVIVGVDRLDHIKGLPQKMRAFEVFLRNNREWRGNVVLIQVAVPSRLGVEEYQRLTSEVNELVGRINGEFSSLDYTPIQYINQSVNFVELCALYYISDVLLVTSLRDGMNLVSYEYAACQEFGKKGPIILSEFTGSAQCLSGAMRVNPWDIDSVAEMIKQALEMPREERMVLHNKVHKYVQEYTSSKWGKSFVDELNKVEALGMQHTKLSLSSCVEWYSATRTRLILLDYDGTLSSIQAHPQTAKPTAEMYELLNALGRNRRNAVFVLSGRNREQLDQWLGDTCVGLIAEHGAFFKRGVGQPWQNRVQSSDSSWMSSVSDIMEQWTERTPGTFIEVKDTTLTWHYRGADPDFGMWQAQELQTHLLDVCRNLPVEIQMGNKTVEALVQGASKSSVLHQLLEEAIQHDRVYDMIMCFGDDRTDEDMFETANNFARADHVVTTRIGRGSSNAKFYLESTADCIHFLQRLAKMSASLS